MGRTIWVLTLLAFGVVTAFAQEAAYPPKGTTCGDSVAVFYEAGPHFDQAASVAPRHQKFLGALLTEGKIAAAGRMKDAPIAIILVRTAKLDEAHALIDEDPFVKEGVVKATYHVWGHCWAVGLPAPDLAK